MPGRVIFTFVLSSSYTSQHKACKIMKSLYTTTMTPGIVPPGKTFEDNYAHEITFQRQLIADLKEDPANEYTRNFLAEYTRTLWLLNLAHRCKTDTIKDVE